MWDPQRYMTFAGERARPFYDLMTRVSTESPGSVVDLGCGPGNLTATLKARWPSARVVGVDSSPSMVAAARNEPGIEVVEADIAWWEPAKPVDVLVSNATLQWVPGHLELLSRFAGWLAPGGWLAFQVPGNFTEASHVLLHRIADSPRWRERVGAGVVARPDSHDPADYLAALVGLGFQVDAWETTYLQVLPGEDAVLDWVSGTALRPVLAELYEAERAEVLAEYGALLQDAYPRQHFGTVLPYRRVFVVARRVPDSERSGEPELDQGAQRR